MTVYTPEAAAVAWMGAQGFEASQSRRRDAGGASPSVTVERTGGYVSNYVDYAEFAVQVWAATELQALEAATRLRNALLTGEPPYGFSGVEVTGGPYLFPDPDSRAPRYQFTFSAACVLVDA